jgi:hypothetical protein
LFARAFFDARLLVDERAPLEVAVAVHAQDRAAKDVLDPHERITILPLSCANDRPRGALSILRQSLLLEAQREVVQPFLSLDSRKLLLCSLDPDLEANAAVGTNLHIMLS